MSIFRVQLYGFAVIRDGQVKLAFSFISNSPIIVGLSIFRIQLYGFAEIWRARSSWPLSK